MLDASADRTGDPEIIRNAVLHLHNEQPLLADLIGMPDPTHTTVVCTNLRTLGGKRPVFADHTESTFFFPMVHIRFIELPPTHAAGGSAEPNRSEPVALGAGETGSDLEIDEDFLRRVRDA